MRNTGILGGGEEFTTVNPERCIRSFFDFLLFLLA